MEDRQFLVQVRFDVESFRWSPESGRVEMYPGNREIWDQTRLLERLVWLLDSHGAHGSFAVAYDLLKRRPEMLAPVLSASGRHEITWHLHLRWDQSFTEDWGAEPPSCYLAGLSESELNRLLDIVHATCERALGFVPKINLNACLSVDTHVLKVLEQRGYLVQGDYSPNTDYRVMEQIRQYRFEGREPIPGGPGGPCYPYAPNNAYQPSRWDGMLLGDMGIVEIPLSQAQPGRGDGRQDTYRNPDAEIAGMLQLYDREIPLTTCSMIAHTHKMVVGPSATDIAEQALADLDRVLGFVRALPGQRFANYLEAREAYLAAFPPYEPGRLAVRDAANGVLAYDGSSSLKIQALGSVETGHPLTIGQENGVAQWVFEGVPLGAECEPKLEDRVYIRPAMLSVDLVSGGVPLGLPRKDLHYLWQEQQNMLGVNLVDPDSGSQFLYVLHENDALSITALPKADVRTPEPVLTGRFNPRFQPVGREPGRVLLKHEDADLYLELRVLTQQNGEWVSASGDPQIDAAPHATTVRLAVSPETAGPVMLVALPFLVVPEKEDSTP